jgi:hypothetical protein
MCPCLGVYSQIQRYKNAHMGFQHVCFHMYVCTPLARCIDKHTNVSRSLTPGGGSDRIRKCIIFLGSLNVKLNSAICIRMCSMHVHSYVFMCKCVFDVFLLRPTARYRRVHGQFVVLEQSSYEVETMDYLYYEMLHFGCQQACSFGYRYVDLRIYMCQQACRLAGSQSVAFPNRESP